MVRGIFQAAKGFREGQVPNQIIVEKVEPFHNVNNRIAAVLFQRINHDRQLFPQQFNARLNMSFLLHYDLFRECRSQKLSHASMISIVCRYDYALRSAPRMSLT